MRTFDFYILRQTVKPLAVVLIVALFVLLIERMLRLLDLVLGAQGPLQIVFEIMAYLVPHYIGLALPISLLLGVMVAFARLSRDGEIDSLQGAGVSLIRQSRGTLIVALAVALVTLAAMGYLKPYGRYAYQQMVYAVTNAAFHAFVRAGVFTEIGDTTFLVRGIGNDEGTFANIFLYQDNGESDTSVITARNGALVRAAEDEAPILRLFDGVRLTLRSTTAPASRPPDSQDAPPVGVLQFRELRLPLDNGQAEMFRGRGIDEREFTLTEIWQRRFEPPPGVRRSDMIAEFNERLVRVISVPFLPLLGIPLALGRRRSDRFYGLAVGLLILVIYNQVLDFGKNLTEEGTIGAFLGLWLPFLIYAAGSTWLLYRASINLPRATGYAVLTLPAPVSRSIASGLARIRLRR